MMCARQQQYYRIELRYIGQWARLAHPLFTSEAAATDYAKWRCNCWEWRVRPVGD